MVQSPRRLNDIPRKDRCGVVSCTPLRFIEAVALRPSLSASDELVNAIIDQELADLKVLILAKRQRHLDEEEQRTREDGNSQDNDE